MPNEEKRNLTDADVRAIVDQVEARAEERFYSDLGKGVWSIAWKAIIVILLGIAAYGNYHK